MVDTGLRRALRYGASFGLLVVLGGVVYAATVERAVGPLINTGIPLGIALVPAYVRRRYDYRLNAVLSFLIVTGAAFHAVGALGLYATVPGFDQVAHGIGGALVAGVGYVFVRAVDAEYDRVVIPPKLRFVFVVVFAMALGTTWELVEFSLDTASNLLGGEGLLVQYDLQDTVLDLQFDLFGALVVALWGTSYFDGARALVRCYVDLPEAE